MTTTQLTLTSRTDGLKLGTTIVSPNAPKGIVQISHGMAEFRGRYLEFQEFLAQNGWASVIHDHRGHGESVKSAEDFGYFYKRGAEAVVEDLHQVTGYVRAKFPGLPTVLLGHSMGSLVARCFLKKFDRDVDGVILSGSPSKRTGASVAKTGLHLFEKGHARSAAVQAIAFGANAKRFEEEPSANCWICSDPAVVAAYDADPRCGFVFTSNGFYNLFKLMQNCYSSAGWKHGNPSLPILFLSGEDDPVLIDKKHFENAVRFLAARGYADVDAKLYPGMRHEILNESGRAEVFADVLKFAEDVRNR